MAVGVSGLEDCMISDLQPWRPWQASPPAQSRGLGVDSRPRPDTEPRRAPQAQAPADRARQHRSSIDNLRRAIREAVDARERGRELAQARSPAQAG